MDDRTVPSGRPRGPAILVAFALLLLGAGCQRMGPEPADPIPPAPLPGPADRPSDEPARERPERAPLPGAIPRAEVPIGNIDPILHADVARDETIRARTEFWKDFWTDRSRDYFGRYLERMGRYAGLVDAELEARGLPASLRYLPIVESGYHHGVTSRVGAAGLWQLMPPTARGLGLTVDGMVDDRRDPVGATRAALDYLEALHDRFDSWYLALSAYNAGQGRVAGILRRYAPDAEMPADERYLRIRRHLPAETREFVPRFFAAAELAREPEAHGFPPVDTGDPFAFDEVTVPDATSFDVIALAAETDEDRIAELNPHFTRGHTPAGVERVVRVPRGAKARFEERYALVPPEHRVSFLEHVVASGETLTHIARRYGVSVSLLADGNGGIDPRRLQIGQRLVVPVGGGGAEGARAAIEGADNAIVAQVSTYRVGPGDTWIGIARRFGVSASALAGANGRSTSDVVRVGEELRIP